MNTKNFIDKLGLIVIKDRKHLVVKPRGKDYWLTPGGKREEGETDKEALIREINEELSLDLIPMSIKYFGVYEAQAQGKPEGTIVRIICYTSDYQGEMKPQAEIESIGWITTEQANEYTDTGRLILEDLKIKNLID